MKKVKIYFILVVAFVSLPLASASAALNAGLKLDGAGSGPSKETGAEASSSAKAIAPASSSPQGSSRDVYLDIKDIEGESAAGPAILEIDTVRGESPENSPPDSANKWPVAVHARELKGWNAEEKQEFVASVKAHAEVQSGQDLENFAKGILLKDENVESVEANEEKVEITYKMPARFLGIFASSLSTRVEVARDGDVSVVLPWYSFLFKKLVAASDIESEVEAGLPEVDDEVLVSFEARARMMTMISNIMKTKHDTVKNSINNLR